MHRLYFRRHRTLRLLTLAKTLLIGGLMLSSAMAFGDAKTLSWQDLLPELDDTLDLSDGIRWGERVRLDLNDEDVRIPGFIVPREYKESEIVTRFLLVPYFGACFHERTAAESNDLCGLRTGVRTGRNLATCLDRGHYFRQPC